MVKIKQLIKDIEGIQVKGSKEIEISGLSSHSKAVAPGDLFFAKKGSKSHGLDYVKDAFLAGAKAIVTDMFNPFYKDKTQIIVDDVAKVEPILAKKFYSDPSKDLYLIGITGTNGKTTVAYLIQHLLSTQKLLSGMIGTVEVITGKNRFFSHLTTPDVISINKYLKEMCSQGVKSCVMEVSSHALDQKRVEGLDFDHVIFTNITQDHLDYHQSFENYLKSKQKLFKKSYGKKKRVATINIDSPYASFMMEELDCITVSLENPNAHFFVKSYQLFCDHTEIVLSYQNKLLNFSYPLVGKFNIYNVVEAISCAYHAGLSFSEIEKRLKNFKSVPGRLQIVPSKKYSVFVDFAHTEDALYQVLMTLKQINNPKIILVFGCGGDRDQDKRSKMGQVASKLADYTIITSDNPRSEDPAEIARMIQSGMLKDHSHEVILDRKEAIKKAIELASSNECVLIAGKGHESYQIFQNKTIEFNDFDVALKLLNEEDFK